MPLHFEVERSKLVRAVDVVSRASATQSSIPALQCILLETVENGKLVLSANNLEIAISMKIEPDVKESGKALVDSRLFSEFVKKAENERLLIKRKDNKLYIYSGESSYDISVLPEQDFPEFPNMNDTENKEISKIDFKELVKSAAFAAAQESSRITLTGCLLEFNENEVKIVATDGYRMAVNKINKQGNEAIIKMIVPSKSLIEFSRLIDDEGNIEFIYSNKNLLLQDKNNEINFFTRLIEGEYIDYERIIPKSYKGKFTISKNKLESSIARASLIITNESVKCPIEIKNEPKVFLYCENQIGKVEEKISYDAIEGDIPHIGFNHKFLIDAVKNAPSEKLTVHFNSNLEPCLITEANEDTRFQFIVLPVRLRG